MHEYSAYVPGILYLYIYTPEYNSLYMRSVSKLETAELSSLLIGRRIGTDTRCAGCRWVEDAVNPVRTAVPF